MHQPGDNELKDHSYYWLIIYKTDATGLFYDTLGLQSYDYIWVFYHILFLLLISNLWCVHLFK